MLLSHKEKLEAAIHNPKARQDLEILKEAMSAYTTWVGNLKSINETGDGYLREALRLLNEYKDYLEVELIARKGSDFLKRQKGQKQYEDLSFTLNDLLIRSSCLASSNINAFNSFSISISLK